MTIEELDRKASSLVDRALALQDEGKWDESLPLLDEAERLCDAGEAAWNALPIIG